MDSASLDPYAPLFDVLREGREHLKIALECRVQAHKGHSSGSDNDKHANRRIFAVVSNVEAGHEEACLLILQRRKKDPRRVKVVAGIPVLPQLKVEVKDGTAKTEQGSAGPSSPSRKEHNSITISLAGQEIAGTCEDEQGIRDLATVLQDTAASAQTPTLNTDADEDMRTRSRGTSGDMPVRQPDDKTKSSHAWMSHYIDLLKTPSALKAAPIFSRFTTSAIVPPKSNRQPAPSPSADEIKVSFGTWNVNGVLPTAETALDPWLHIVDDDPDIVVVGLEEADSSGLSYVVWTPQVEAAWSQAIGLAMGRQAHEYEKLASRQLVGVLMLVYVKRSLRPRLSKIGHAAIGVGFGGWAANKGAAALRFELDKEMSFCFVVSHLSAFEGHEALERRRWDYHEITRRLRLPLVPHKANQHDNTSDSESDEPSSSNVSMSRSDSGSDDHPPIGRSKPHHHGGKHIPRKIRRKLTARFNGDGQVVNGKSLVAEEVEGHDPDTSVDAESMLRAQLQRDSLVAAPMQIAEPPLHRDTHILDHDVVFWGGDLNFRIDLSTSETKRLIPRQQYEETLLKFDQLRNEVRNTTCFEGFQEQRILFAPTYKFDRGSDVYDTSEKQRCPSWTDRVLWRERALLETNGNIGNTQPAKRVTSIAYESCPSLRISDHKPVLATFLVNTGKPPFSKP